MKNITEYTGKPYSRKYACWDHVHAVRTDADLPTPRYDVQSDSVFEAQALFAKARDESTELQLTNTPQDYDVILMAARWNDRLMWHSGVYYKGLVSHCCNASKQVKLESLEDIKKRFCEVEFWR